MAKRKRRFQTVKWTELKKGDTIKVIGSNGPYMEIGGKKHYIGVPPGKYTVDRVNFEQEGVHIYDGINHNFMYMGEDKDSIVGVKSAHKFKKFLVSA